VGVERVLTEDFQHGREIGGVRFVDPFLSEDSP
jgi:predicted nucleic acid-binding protein